MKRYVVLLLLLIFVSLITTGCGETVGGIAKDAKRMQKGIKTIFIKEE